MKGNTVFLKRQLLALIFIVVFSLSTTCVAANPSPTYAVDYPGNLMVFVSNENQRNEWIDCGIPNANTILADSFNGFLPNNIHAVAVDCSISESLPLTTWAQNGIRIYMFGQSVLLEDFNEAVGIEYLGRSIRLGENELIKKIDDTQSFQVVAYQDFSSTTDSLCAILQPIAEESNITTLHFYNVICSDFSDSHVTTRSTIVDADDNILVSAANGLVNINGVWTLYQNTNETVNDKDFFAIQGFLTPTVIGGGQVAQFDKVTASIVASSNDSLYDVEPQTTISETTISGSLDLSAEGVTGGSIGFSKTYSTATTVRMNKPSTTTANWTYTNDSDNLNNNEYMFGSCIIKSANSGTSQTMDLTMKIGGTAGGWSTNYTLGPENFYVSYDYRSN